MTHDPADTGNRALARAYRRGPAKQGPDIVAEADAPEYLLNALRSATSAQLAHALRAAGASPDRGGLIQLSFWLDEPHFKIAQTYGVRRDLRRSAAEGEVMTPAEVRAHLYAKPSPACVAEGAVFRRSPIGSRVTNNHLALVRSGIPGDDLRVALIARINQACGGPPRPLFSRQCATIVRAAYDAEDNQQRAIVRAVVDYAQELDGLRVDDLEGCER